METNYTDERFGKVETDKQEAMSELDKTYDGMIESSDQYYEAQINASKEWADKQSQLQKENTDFTIEQIEQQKEQAQKDYTKEQSGAYVDWQKQTAQHGVNAEQMAAAGLAGSGYSESSKVSMYNTYQNRVATAREAYSRAVLNYDNAIKEARLQNNSALAEIAYQALQQQLELSLQGFQYKNQLILDKASKRTELDNIYYGRYMDVLNQINYEKEFAEQVRQFEASYGLQAAQLAESQRQFDMEYRQDAEQFDSEMQRLLNNDANSNQVELALLKAQYGDYSGLEKLGVNVDPEVIAAMKADATTTGATTTGAVTPTSLTETDISELRALYPEGVIPSYKWEELTEKYGLSALKSAGFQKQTRYTARIEPTLVNDLQSMYPSGFIPADEWDELVRNIDGTKASVEKALAVHGFSKFTPNVSELNQLPQAQINAIINAENLPTQLALCTMFGVSRETIGNLIDGSLVSREISQAEADELRRRFGCFTVTEK